MSNFALWWTATSSRYFWLSFLCISDGMVPFHHCSVYKDMRIFTYSTSAISRQWFHSVNSQWGAKAGPALRLQLNGLTSSAGTLCAQTHCPALRWGDGSSSGLNPNPAPSTFDLLSSLRCGNYISCLNPSALEGLRLGLPDSWSLWDSLVATQHKHAEDPEHRGEELGVGKAGWRLVDSAGAVMGPPRFSMTWNVKLKLIFVFVEHHILPLPSWGNWGRDRRLRWSERGG